MFSPSLVNKAEKVLSEYFPLGCRASTRTRDFALFCEKLQAETGTRLDLNANEALDLLKLAGTCVDGLVYPFKTLEPKPEKSATNNSRQTTNINTSERKESAKSVRTFGGEVLKIKRIPRDQIPSDTVKLIANVLYKNFKTGFSLRRAADMKRFRSLVRSLDSDSLLNRKSDASLRNVSAALENDSTQAPNLNRQSATAPRKPAETNGALGESACDLLQSILTERFANGFRLNSTIEAARLRKFAQETGCEEGAAVARLDDAALRNAVRKSGVVCDDKVYVVDKATDATIRAEVESAFDSGARAIFYESLFERVVASAPDYFSLELLKDRVRSLYAVSDRKIRFAENYLNIYIYI